MSIKITSLNDLKAKPRFPTNLAGWWESRQLLGLGISGVRGSLGRQGRACSQGPSSQPGQGRPGAARAARASGTRYLPGDGDSLGHQPVGGSPGPDPGGPGPGTLMAMALRELELRWGPNSRGCELAPSPPSPGSGRGCAVRALTDSLLLVILLYNLHTSIFLTGRSGDRDRGQRQ